MPSRCCASSSDFTATAKLAVDAYDAHCCKLVALAQGLVALAWNVCPAQELQSLTKQQQPIVTMVTQAPAATKLPLS